MLATALAKILPRWMNAAMDNPAWAGWTDPEAWNDMFGGHMTTDAGVNVSHKSALTSAAVWQCISLISGDVSILPFHIFNREPNGDREIATEEPAEFLISDQPNDEMPAEELWRRVMVHAPLWGNGYIWIETRGGVPVGLFNLLPDRTNSVRLASGKLMYVTHVDGVEVPLMPAEVIHVKGMSLDRELGIDVISKARNAIGLGLAAEGFGSAFFAHGAQAGGILELPLGMKPKATENVEKGWIKQMTGQKNWFKTALLRDGVKFHQTMVDAEKSQLHELREDQVREAGRFWNVPPFKLGLKDSQSYNSNEIAQRVYLQAALQPWLTAIQAACRFKLISVEKRKARAQFMEHDVKKLIATDIKTLNDVLAKQRALGIINSNEYRREFNRNARTDPGGDDYGNPNTSSGAAGGPPALPPGEGDDEDGDQQPSNDAHRRLFAECVGRFSRRLAAEWRKADKAGKDLNTIDVINIRFGILSAAADSIDEHHGWSPGQCFGQASDAVNRVIDDISKAGGGIDEMCDKLETDLPLALMPLALME